MAGAPTRRTAALTTGRAHHDFVDVLDAETRVMKSQPAVHAGERLY